MIDWNKHEDATCVSVTYFDDNGDAISTSWADRPTQTKTVADAVGECKKWRDGYNYLARAAGVWCWYVSKPPVDELVCTREQFEAYVKEQESKITMDDINEHISTGEQEGEKWTHYYMGNEHCKIVVETPDKFGVLVVDCEDNGYMTCEYSDLKPIKPRLTESAMLSRIAELARGTLSDDECGDKIRELFDMVEVI